MKRLLSVVLALVLTLSIGVISFASDEETVPFFDGSGADYWGPDCQATAVSLIYPGDIVDSEMAEGITFEDFGKHISVRFSKEFLESVNASDLRYIWFTLCEDDVFYKVPDYSVYFHDFENNGDVSVIFSNTFLNELGTGTHKLTLTINDRIPFDIKINTP